MTRTVVDKEIAGDATVVAFRKVVEIMRKIAEGEDGYTFPGWYGDIVESGGHSIGTASCNYSATARVDSAAAQQDQQSGKETETNR